MNTIRYCVNKAGDQSEHSDDEKSVDNLKRGIDSFILVIVCELRNRSQL